MSDELSAAAAVGSEVLGAVVSSASACSGVGAAVTAETRVGVEGSIESSASERDAAGIAGAEGVECAHRSQHVEVSQLAAAVRGARVRSAESAVSGTGVWVRDKLHATAAMESEALGAIESLAGAHDGGAAAAASET